MSSSSNYALITELLNQAKLVNDAQSKVFILEQIKEVLFHREPALLQHVLQDVFDFMVDKSVAIRKFLIHFAAGVVRRNISTVPSIVSLFTYLAAEKVESVHRMILSETTKVYSLIVFSISNMPLKKAGSTALSPKDIWNQFRNTVNLLMDSAINSKNESCRLAYLQLLESILLFGIPSSLSAIPSSSSSTTHNVSEIPLHNTNIDRTVIESDSESLLSKVVLWARRGGPQDNPFSTNELTSLGKIIGRLALERRSARPSAALALTFLLDRRENSGDKREYVRLATAILEVSDKPSLLDLDNPLNKLKASLQRAKDTLVALDVNAPPLPPGTPTTPTAESLKKRSISMMEADDVGEGLEGDPGASRPDKIIKGEEAAGTENTEEVDEDVDSEAFQQSVVLAVNKAQISLHQAGGSSTNQYSTSTSSQSQLSSSHSSSALELAADILQFPDYFPHPSMRIHSVDDLSTSLHQSSPSLRMVSKLDEYLGSGTRSSRGDLVVHVTAPSQANIYADMALDSLKRNLDALFESSKGTNTSHFALRLQMSLRLVLSMSLMELDSQRDCVSVNIINTATVSPTMGLHGLPPTVPLPRPLWLFVSYLLGRLTGSHNNNVDSKNITGSSVAMDVLLCLLQEMHRRALPLFSPSALNQNENNDENKGKEEDASGRTDNDRFYLYDSLSLALFSRFIQKRDLRQMADQLLKRLPRVSVQVVQMLGKVCNYGSKGGADASQVMTGKNKGAADRKDKGTSTVAMALLSKIIAFVADTDSSSDESGRIPPSVIAALRCLLWMAVSEDFGMRSKAVSRIVEDVIPRTSDALRLEIFRFSIHSLLGVLGPHIFKESDDSAEHQKISEEADEMNETIEDEDGDVTSTLPSLKSLASEFDFGSYFGGEFEKLNVPGLDNSNLQGSSVICHVQVPASQIGRVESFIRRHLHLVCQLSLDWPRLLKTLIEICICSIEFNRKNSEATPEKVKLEDSVQPVVSATEVPVSDSTTSSADAPSSQLVDERLLDIFARVVRGELLQTLIPALVRSYPSKKLFQFIETTSPHGRDFVLSSLDLLLPDPHLPPDQDLVAEVKHFISKCKECSDSENSLEIRCLSVVVGGLSKEEVITLLPQFVSTFGSGEVRDAELLRKSFVRIVQARPPPLSQCDLLVALHRIDPTSPGMKTKSLLEAIGQCLSNRELFRFESIKDAVSILLTDTNLSICLMRTVILSSQTYADMRKFGLNEVVPKLVQIRSWENAPRVWEGVAMFVKSFITTKDAEPSLRAILGLASAQLRAILKVAPNAKPPLAKLLKALSSEERIEVLSGKWVGLVSSEETDLEAKIDADKLKLIKDIEATQLVTK